MANANLERDCACDKSNFMVQIIILWLGFSNLVFSVDEKE